MAIKTVASLKSFFEAGDKPSEAQFGDLIDSTYSGEIGAAIVSAASAGSTGLLQIDSASAVSFLVPGSAGRAVVTASTQASVRTVIGAASAGDAIFQIGTVGSVRSFIGAASTSAATTASAGLIEIATTAEASAGTDNTKAMTPATHAAVVNLTRETEQATTSGTSFDFTGISADAKRITVIFNGVSLSGTDDLAVQIGDSGGIETSGYDSVGGTFDGTNQGTSSSSSLFVVRIGAAADSFSGHMELTNISGNIWVASHAGTRKGSANFANSGGGVKTLSGTLDRIRILATGANTFDAGSVNLLIET